MSALGTEWRKQIIKIAMISIRKHKQVFSQPPDRKKSGGFFGVKKQFQKNFCRQEHFVFLTLGQVVHPLNTV